MEKILYAIAYAVKSMTAPSSPDLSANQERTERPSAGVRID